MALKLGQSLKLGMNLAMTPQLQQAIKLLALNHLEMCDTLSQEMVNNPLLEEFSNQQVDSDHQLSVLETANEEAKSSDFEAPHLIEGKENFDWQSYAESFTSNSSAPVSSGNEWNESGEQNSVFENIASQGMTLSEHLLWQLKMNVFTNEEFEFGQKIIENINEDGHLEIPFDEILASENIARPVAIGILEKIQFFDPVGCGSVDLQECLLIQAKLISPRNKILEKIILKYLREVEKNQVNSIVESMGVSQDKVIEAIEILKSFNPKPGRMISPSNTEYIVPDVYVRDSGESFEIKLNDEGLPRLRIAKIYQKLLRDNAKISKQEKDYVVEKMKAALFLLKSVHNRQNTIKKVVESIVRHQSAFFRKGASFLRPMILRDIAAEIGMHESTVSRVTTNKYLHCRIGTFELKYFFNSAIGAASGGAEIASEPLKLKIKQIIENEPPHKPYSDQKIGDILQKQGFQVARRTVAKYRDELGIQAASTRKK